MFNRYDFEAEFYPNLARLPLDLRRKLDISGIRISLKDWLSFSVEERRALCHLPCDEDDERQVFAGYLDFLAGRYLGKSTEKSAPMDPALWHEQAVPDAVARRSAQLDRTVAALEWRHWPAHHRYALYKSAVSQKQPEAFAQILTQLRKSTASD